MGFAGGLSDGRAQLCGDALAACQEDGARQAAHRQALTRLRSVSVLRQKAQARIVRVAADTLDHRAQAVGTLWRQVLAKPELVERLDGVETEDFLGRLT